MSKEIKIYGEIVPFQDDWILEGGGYCNLSHVQKQLAKCNGEDVTVRINSFGGDVDEGFAIYSELRRYAKDNNATITTLAEGRCASIATVFFLAGDKRIVTEYTEPFVHNAWTYTIGDSKTLLKASADLERCNDKIAKHYEKHTNLTYEESRVLMDDETAITAEECLALRFATEIEQVLRPVALQSIIKNKYNLKQVKMANKKKSGFKAMLKKALGFQNKVLKTAEDLEVDFPELEDTDTPAVGDKATVDGNSNYTGEVVMADGQTFVFEDGTLTEIKEVGGEQNQEGDEPIDEQDVEEIKEDLEEIKETLVTIIEEVVPELAKLNKENKRLNSALAKLQSVEPVAPSGKHERTSKDNKKNQKIDFEKLNVNLKK